jgi:hypothetical protein
MTLLPNVAILGVENKFGINPIDIPEEEQARAQRPPMHSVKAHPQRRLRAGGTIRVSSHS